MNRPEIRHEPLVYEYRGDILDNVHMGCLALVDEVGKVVILRQKKRRTKKTPRPRMRQ